MKADIKAIVRGEGRIYAKVALSAPGPLRDAALVARTESGDVLPSDWLAWRGQGEERVYVAVLPFLAGGRVVMDVTAQGADGSAHASTLAVSMGRAKWVSRMNYLARRRMALELRGSDECNLFERVNFWFADAMRVPGTDELVVHGFAWYARDDDVELEFTFFDGQGARTDWKAVFLGKDTHPSSLEPLQVVQDVHFSVRVPSAASMFTVVARDSRGTALSGFCSLEPDWFQEVCAMGDAMLTDAGGDGRYHAWFMEHRATPGNIERQRHVAFDHGALFSIVVPLYRTPVDLFDEMVASVMSQSYEKWELVLVNASPDDDELLRHIDRVASGESRVRVISLDGNRGIAENTAEGIRSASGDFVCFLDHDDAIEPDALYEYARAISLRPRTDLLYCDEDKLMPDGTYANVFFKTDFNIDLLRGHNYVCHFLCVRRSVLDGVDLPSRRYDGAQDHDLVLKVSEVTDEIFHVRKVLYHWRVVEGSTASADRADEVPKGFAVDAGRAAVEEHLARLGIDAEVLPTEWPYTHRVRYRVQGSPLVSIVIPNKDCREMLDECVRSILEKTVYPHYEIVVVENNSVDSATFDYYEQLEQQDGRIKVVRWPGEFNFSKIVNFGVARSAGEYVLLLNNDTAVIEGEWLADMLGICQRADVGAVGAKLLYPDGTIQHAGVVVTNPDEVARHCYARLPETHPGYFLQAALTMDYSIVTAACMLTERALFDEVGGFEEGLAVAYNDVDYCLKLRDRGLLVVYEPHARLYHYESVSRGYDFASPEKKLRAYREQALVHSRWPKVFVEGDPFFNPNLRNAYHVLKVGDGDGDEW